jgi:hypothetical protein
MKLIDMSINVEKSLDKREKNGWRGIPSENLKGVSYAVNRREIDIITSKCGALNISIDSWEDLKSEIDEIIKDIRR